MHLGYWGGDEVLLVWHYEVLGKLLGQRYRVTASSITPLGNVLMIIDSYSDSCQRSTYGVIWPVSLAFVNDGRYAVTWSPQGQQPFLQVFNASDVPVSPPVTMGSGVSFMNLAWDGSSLMATYFQNNSVRMAAFDANGTLTKSPFIVSGGTSIETVAPPVAVPFDGGFWVQWNGDFVSGSTPSPLYGRVVLANGTVGTNPVVMTPMASATGALATSLNSGFVTVWYNSSLLHIQAYRYDATPYGAVITVAPGSTPENTALSVISNHLCITWKDSSLQLVGKIIDLPPLPTLSPTVSPTLEPTPFPTTKLIIEPTPFPTLEPTPVPSSLPTNSPTPFPLPNTLTSQAESAPVRMPESTRSTTPKDPGLAVAVAAGAFLLLLVAGVSFYLRRRKQRPTVQEVQEPTEAVGAYGSIGLRRITRGYDHPPLRKKSRPSVSSVGYDNIYISRPKSATPVGYDNINITGQKPATPVGYDDVDITRPKSAVPVGYDYVNITRPKSAVPVGYDDVDLLRPLPGQYGNLQLSPVPSGGRAFHPPGDPSRSRRHSKRVS